MKVTQFLMGLNDVYTNIRGQLLMMNPIPSLSSVLSLVQEEERQHNYVHLAQPTIEYATLLNTNDYKKKDQFKKPGFKHNNLECTYCHGKNHTRECCYHLIGFPQKSKNTLASGFSKNSQLENKVIAQVATSSQAPIRSVSGSDQMDTINQGGESVVPALSASQYQQLISILNQNQVSQSSNEPPQSSITHLCSYMTSICFTNCHSSNDWIVASGTTDHITCSHELLSDIVPCDVNICLPNGTHTKVYLKGTLRLSSEIVLYDVLLVPYFYFNLISVSKLTSNLKCVFQFLSNLCVIQDCKQKRILGIGKLNGKLYKLFLPVSSQISSTLFPVNNRDLLSVCNTVNSPDVNSSILWHSRLGNLSFKSLSQIPDISCNVKSCTNSPCDVCHFAKQNELDPKSPNIEVPPDFNIFSHMPEFSPQPNDLPVSSSEITHHRVSHSHSNSDSTLQQAQLRILGGNLILGNGLNLTGWTAFPAKALVNDLPLLYNETISTCDSAEKVFRDPKNLIIICKNEYLSATSMLSFIANSNAIAGIIISDKQSVFTDGFPYPAIVISLKEGLDVIKYAQTSSNPSATITFQQTFVGTKPEPAVAAYSSRGPSPSCPGILKPDIMAPGTLVLASWIQNDPSSIIGPNIQLCSDFKIISGTSMACLGCCSSSKRCTP
ncbi:hypothetical protein AgCh_014866 [Apium graveolens]